MKLIKPDYVFSLTALTLVLAATLTFIRLLNGGISDSAANAGKSLNVGPIVNVATIDTSQRFVAVGKMVGNASDEVPYEISLWDVKGNTLLWSKRTDSALSLAFSPDSRVLASDSHKGVAIWRVSDGSLMDTLDSGEMQESGVANKQVVHLVFSGDGSTVAATGPFKLWLWKMPEGAMLKTLDLSECGMANRLRFSPDGQILAVGCGEFNHAEIPDPSRYPILLFGLKNLGWLPKELEGHITEVSSLDFSPNSRILASAGGRSDGELRLWDL
jgi:WD40 repeat protein